jgi:sugar/nucleoside kinase (ribokinase family)
MKKLQAVVAGHFCFDVIPAFKKELVKDSMAEIFVPGKLINMDGVKVSTGGPVSNTGIAMSILGLNVELMGKIGDDYFGDGVIKCLAERGMEKAMTVAKGENTSYTVVIVPQGFDRIFLHHTGANDTFCADDIDYEKIKQASLFHFGYPPLMKKMYENDGEELVEIFKRAKSTGATTSLDMSLPDPNSASGKANWDKILQKLLPYVDLYLPSIEESMYMIARDDFNELQKMADGGDLLNALDLNKLQEVGNKLLSYGAKIVVLKCGVMGYYIRTSSKEILAQMGRIKPADLDNWSDRELHEESFHVPKVAAATGSGDSSIAGFLAAFFNEKSIEETIRIACCVGGQNVQVFDALSNIHNWEETIEMINGWQKNKHNIDGGYWKYNEKAGNWVGRKDKFYE